MRKFYLIVTGDFNGMIKTGAFFLLLTGLIKDGQIVEL
jgi:hypothetical protein